MIKKEFILWPTNLLRPKYNTECSSDQRLITLLQSCKQSSVISQIHGLMIKTCLDHTPFTLSKLLAYSTFDIDYASSIFKRIQNPNLYMLNTMLRAYSISDNPKQTLNLFNYMRAKKFSFDEFTFVSVLKSSANLFAVCTGLSVHSLVLKSGVVLLLNVKNTLMHFYCVCGRIADARQLFDEFSGGRDLVSWNTLMGGYLCVCEYYGVVELFRQLCGGGFGVGKTTMLTVLSAAGELDCVLGGESLHGYCMKIGLCFDLNVVSSLISMYGKMGCIDYGRRLFDEVDVKDIVLWNCMIDGYAKNGQVEAALSLLESMKREGIKPNTSTLVGLLSACAASAALDLGQRIHDYVEELRLELDAVLGTGLVNMYAKCGLLSKAIDVFNRIQSKDVKCWTAMILSYGLHGKANNATSLYYRMEEEGFRANEVTFLAVLNACCHGGLVTEGISCFRKMVGQYGMKPEIEHYGCLIDLLGRAGMLEDAHELIKSLPIESDATAWRALLAACRVHGNVELGELVKAELERVYNEHPADSLILTSTYAIAGRIPDLKITLARKGDSVKEVESTQNAKKEAGCSTIQLSNKECEQNWESQSSQTAVDHMYATRSYTKQ